MRLVILGMNNPLSSRPEHALWPDPPGCTGHRILSLLRIRLPSLTEAQYLARLDRRNLINCRVWDSALAESAAVLLVAELRDSGRSVVVLGGAVRRALRLSRAPLAALHLRGCAWWQLPHPSGRCRWYNEAKNREAAAKVLVDLLEKSR